MQIKDLQFKQFINKSKIQEKVRALAEQINTDYKDKQPVFLPVLNGSFVFAADLIKHVEVPCKVSFVKVSSYAGAVSSSGQLKTLIGLEASLFNQDVILVEDIVDTGLTLQKIIEELKGLGTKSVEVVALLRKQPARDKMINVKYVGFEIDHEFVVGYGLDYDGLGRNLKEIYKAQPAETKTPVPETTQKNDSTGS
ncbi:hypoxanthine phosphoribosyltransferase [Ohtaekwangia sp.]|uniref:hypoxanthine phosphoribosyltransferase n=1 Tax=Ohtaekwangia sp. TaxID=2066019 RepID=UPI002F95D159